MKYLQEHIYNSIVMLIIHSLFNIHFLSFVIWYLLLVIIYFFILIMFLYKPLKLITELLFIYSIVISIYLSSYLIQNIPRLRPHLEVRSKTNLVRHFFQRRPRHLRWRPFATFTPNVVRESCVCDQSWVFQ